MHLSKTTKNTILNGCVCLVNFSEIIWFNQVADKKASIAASAHSVWRGGTMSACHRSTTTATPATTTMTQVTVGRQSVVSCLGLDSSRHLTPREIIYIKSCHLFINYYIAADLVLVSHSLAQIYRTFILLSPRVAYIFILPPSSFTRAFISSFFHPHFHTEPYPPEQQFSTNMY